MSSVQLAIPPASPGRSTSIALEVAQLKSYQRPFVLMAGEGPHQCLSVKTPANDVDDVPSRTMTLGVRDDFHPIAVWFGVVRATYCSSLLEWVTRTNRAIKGVTETPMFKRAGIKLQTGDSPCVRSSISCVTVFSRTV